jgi:FtsP/CotA-like multicopper oxidase with cupredoxin domain
MTIPSLTPFVDDLPIPQVIKPTSGKLTISAQRFRVKLHSNLPGLGAWVWGYKRLVGTIVRPGIGQTYLGPTVEVLSSEKVKVTWVNNVTGNLSLIFPVVKVSTTDAINSPFPSQNLPGSVALPAVPGSADAIIDTDDDLRLKLQSLKPVLVTHLHGGSTQADYDGWPDNILRASQAVEYTYYNNQSPATLWYHDHANHVTRTNVYAGLAGMWLIRDPAPWIPPWQNPLRTKVKTAIASTQSLTDPILNIPKVPAQPPREETALDLPSGEFEIPLVIQDRNLEVDATGTAFLNPTQMLHKTEVDGGPAEFFGPYTLVNGKIWPKLTVSTGLYRFRIVNGSNARTYRLVLLYSNIPDDPSFPLITKNASMRMTLIGTDQGLRQLTQTIPNTGLVLAPGERADVLIDFSFPKKSGNASSIFNLPCNFYLWNVAESPFGDDLAGYTNLLNPAQELADLIINPHKEYFNSLKLRPYPQIMRFDIDTALSTSGKSIPSGSLRQTSPWKAEPTAGMTVRLMCLVERPTTTGETITTAVTTTVINSTPQVVSPVFSGTDTIETIIPPRDTPMLVFWEYVEVDDFPIGSGIYPIGSIPFTYVHPVTGISTTGHYIKAAEEFNDTLNWMVPVDTTELWYFVNLSPDTHPIHVHLVDMKVIDRQSVTISGTTTTQPIDGNTDVVTSINIDSSGGAIPFDFDQTDAKDTVRVNPGEAIGVAMKFGPYCGKYMIHCHILEHEDSDMMRPFVVYDHSVPHHH